MFALEMSNNVEDVLGLLSDLGERHIPFAMALALTNTAKDGREAIQQEMPEHFTLRTGWTRRGVRYQMARPADLAASVYTQDWYMETQEAGGQRRPQSAKELWIPTLAARNGGALSGRVMSRFRPDNIRKGLDAPRKNRKARGSGAYAKPKAFVIGKNVFIRQDQRRLPLIKLFTLAPSVKLPARWQFEKTMDRVTGKQLRRRFLEALDQALSTSRAPVDAGDRLVVEHLMESGDGGLFSVPSFEQTLIQNAES